MMLSENLRIGIASVRKARFRSFFTMLGIIIGVVSVVTVVSLGEGVKRQVTGQVADLGTNLITVRPGKLVNRDESGKITSVNLFASTGIASLTDKDVFAIRKVNGIQSAAALGTMSGIPSYNGKEFKDGVIVVSTQDLIKVIDHEVEFGTFFDDEMINNRNAIIGPGVAEKLFNETIPIGKSVTVRGQNFTVQGIFEPFTEIPITSGIDLNNAVFLPEPVANDLLGSEVPIYEILAKAKTAEAMRTAASAVESALRANHAGQEDYTVLRQDEVSAASDELLGLLTKMIIGMAGITLLVGGIGIMNVMLVSVTERTREIGIRKAIGATNRQIRTQFMIEATILSVWGVMLGVIFTGLLNIILRIFTDLEPVLLWQPIVFASIVSVAIGILFGVIPAVKASRKDPIDSLRPY